MNESINRVYLEQLIRRYKQKQIKMVIQGL